MHMKIMDYSALTSASETIRSISEVAFSRTDKIIEEQKSDVLGQIEDWLLQTFAPILRSDMIFEPKFTGRLRFWASDNCVITVNGRYEIKVRFRRNNGSGVDFNYDLYLYRGVGGDVYLKWDDKDRSFFLEHRAMVEAVIKSWSGIKAAIERQIEYAHKEYNKAKLAEVESENEFCDLLNSFSV